MKVLVLCNNYPSSIEGSYLTSELADAWAKDGHEVEVVALQWTAKEKLPNRRLTFPSGVRTHYFAPQNTPRFGVLIDRVARWGLSSFLVRKAVRKAIGQQQFDFVFVFGPAVTLAGLIIEYVHPNESNYLYVTDFFPFAHKDIGLVSKGAMFRLTKYFENALMRRFTTIGCMSAKNSEFLRSRYNLRDEQHVVVDHLWGVGPYVSNADRSAIRVRYDLPVDKTLLLFGGQLSEGRGIDEVIEASRLARLQYPDLCFVIIGGGRLQGLVERAVQDGDHNLLYMRAIPRADYLDLAMACDIGLVVTVANTDVPTFPSRSIDYLRVGLPIVASVEASTDFGEFIESSGVGVSLVAGDPQKLVETVERFWNDRPKFEAAQLATYKIASTTLSVDQVAKRILTHDRQGNC